MIPSATAPNKEIKRLYSQQRNDSFTRSKHCSNQVRGKWKLNGTLRTGSPWFDVFDSFIAFICAFAALPAADLSNSSCLQVEGKKGYNWG